PTFTLQSAQGGEYSTWSVKGKKNLVVFVFGKTCDSGCRELLSAAARDYKLYKENNAEVVAIFRTNRESADDLRNELSLPFHVLVDLEGFVTSRLVYTPPAIFITDRFGEVVEEFLGDEALKVSQEKILA